MRVPWFWDARWWHSFVISRKRWMQLRSFERIRVQVIYGVQKRRALHDHVVYGWLLFSFSRSFPSFPGSLHLRATARIASRSRASDGDDRSKHGRGLFSQTTFRRVCLHAAMATEAAAYSTCSTICCCTERERRFRLLRFSFQHAELIAFAQKCRHPVFFWK